MTPLAAVSERATIRIRSGGVGQPLVAVRYRLRVAVHRMIADCERLLNELEGPSGEMWQQAVGRALVSAQRIRAIVDRWKVHRDDEDGAASVERLYEAIDLPREAVVEAMTVLLAMIPIDLEEELILQDARGIRDAAVGLFAPESASGPEVVDAPAAGSADSAALPANRTTTVLVVDDDATLRGLIARLLERLGYVALEAPDGRAAVQRAERDMPDLVITDLDMPGMTGEELLSHLKSNRYTRHIPVIVVSGREDTDSVVRCLELGAEDHLSKPVEPLVLRARLRTSLERKRMRDLEMAYLSRVGQLTAAAEAVELNAYDSLLIADLVTDDDQLGQLARVFDRMINGMRTREEQLEARVRKLRTDIQHASSSFSLDTSLAKTSAVKSGQVIAGRYEIQRELGRGGMGMVYLAQDLELAEEVALKVVHRDVFGQDPSLLERLKWEMRTARRISHRNVVRSHDLGEWEGMYFLTMEYIKGVTVDDLIATRGRLAVDSTLAIATQLADALGVAHEAGVIHRDIKPQNLLVDESGVLKVTDFGLARPVHRNDHLTLQGHVVGTPGFMAPEQLLGGAVDGRTDLFAMGVVLYNCLTGREPYEASTPMGVVARVLDGSRPSVRTLAPEVPMPVASVVERLLQRDPARRFQSAREVADQLAILR